MQNSADGFVSKMMILMLRMIKLPPWNPNKKHMRSSWSQNVNWFNNLMRTRNGSHKSALEDKEISKLEITKFGGRDNMDAS